MPSGAEERAQNSDRPVVRFGCATVGRTGGRVVAVRVCAVLFAAAQGGRALVAAGEGGEHRHLQSCRRTFPGVNDDDTLVLNLSDE